MKFELDSGCVGIIGNDKYGVSVSVHMATRVCKIEGDSVLDKTGKVRTSWIEIKDNDGGEVTLFTSPDTLRVLIAEAQKQLAMHNNY